MKTIRTLIILLLVFSCDNSSDNASTKTMNLALNLETSSNSKQKVSNNSVKIISFKFLIEKIKYHSTESSDSLDFKTGPIVVSVDSNNTIADVTSAELPIGSYKKITFKMHKPSDGETISDTDFTTGGKYSLIIKGIYNDSPFTFYSDETMKEELFFDPAIEITESGTSYNTTIKVNSSSWFYDSKKQMNLDPTNSSDASAIEKQIKESFKAFKDNNKDGKSD